MGTKTLLEEVEHNISGYKGVDKFWSCEEEVVGLKGRPHASSAEQRRIGGLRVNLLCDLFRIKEGGGSHGIQKHPIVGKKACQGIASGWRD